MGFNSVFKGLRQLVSHPTQPPGQKS